LKITRQKPFYELGNKFAQIRVQAVNVFRSLILGDIMKAKFGMKPSVMMFLKSLLYQRQECLYFLERNPQMPVLGAFNQLAVLIVFSNTPALNVVADIVRRFANNSGRFFNRY